MKKSDFLAALIIGEADALLILLIAKNLGQPLDLIKFLPLILPVLAVLGIYIAGIIGKKIPVVFQVAKFLGTGTLNMFLDLGVLNFLMFVFGISSGFLFSIFKGVSFICAAINSYIWNKFWTFGKKETTDAPKEFLQFFAVAIIGFLLNIATASLIVNIMGPQFGISAKLWANIGALVASIVTAVCQFIGYKFLVFKK